MSEIATVRDGESLGFPVNSYCLVDFNISLEENIYSFSFYITNLMDDYELASAIAFDTFTGPNNTAVLVPTRTVGIVISMNF